MGIEESMKIYGAKIDALLKEIIPPHRNDYLSEPIWHHLHTGGKRVRPAICLITCEALGGNTNDAIHFALAIEIMNNMFLMHADIEAGCYLACGMVGGAVVSGISEKVVEKIWTLGKTMGPAFQIRDDLIDLTHGKGRGGAIGSDVKEGKASFLYSYALQVASADDKKHLRDIMLKPRDETTDNDIKLALEIYKKYNAIKYAQDYAEDLVKQAYRTIDEIPVDDKTVFKEIASFMANRMS